MAQVARRRRLPARQRRPPMLMDSTLGLPGVLLLGGL